MGNQIVSSLFQAISSCFDWFYDIIDESGLTGILFGSILLALIGCFIIMPIRNGNKSMAAKESIKKSHSSKEN